MDGNSGYVLEMKEISKGFPGVKALDHVNLNLKQGEVLALCGENGAGKSTLMKVLCGLYQPDEGEIYYQNKKVCFKHPNEAKQAGIIMVFQELSLVTDLSVAENIYLGSLPMQGIKVNWKKLKKDAAKVLEEIGCGIDPETPVGTLPIAQRQMVEIARGMALGARILILDEPTSSLTDKEKEAFFENIRVLKEKGAAIVYISHKMDEIMEICDRAVVLRDGKNSGEFNTANCTIHDIIQGMIGRAMSNYYVKNKAVPGEELLRVEHLTKRGQYQDISFCVHRGEIVGLYGLVGAGRTELMESIFGITRPDSGKIYYKGEKVKIKNSGDAVKHKMAFVPENRKEQGLVLGETCRKNMILALLPWMKRWGIVDVSRSYQVYDEYKNALKINAASSEQLVLQLSGGNQQKIVLGKWLAIHPDLLILDEPTRGIDIGAKADIHRFIAQLAKQGMAVILISSEMPEIIGVSNRLLCIREGRICARLEGDHMNEESIIHAIMGEESAMSHLQEVEYEGLYL